VHDRLLSIAADRREDFNSVLARYVAERFLYRLTRTRHGKRFVLKGAMLFILWLGRLDRPTRDLDLLGSGEISEETLRTIFTDVCRARVRSDGLEFDEGSITVREIRENQVYQGFRVKVRGRLGNARVGVHVDVGVGDAVTPEPTETDYPTLLDLPSPRLKTYPRETVVAEKLNAMVQLGLRNSRMKDFFDLWLMSKSFAFDGIMLAESIRRTFERRQTLLETQSVCFQDAFARDTSKQTQWKALVQRGHLVDVPNEFRAVMEQIRRFLHPVIVACAERRDFDMQWPLGGPWQPRL
jgi:predicted nucleotidyltransferase component of viral defense system